MGGSFGRDRGFRPGSIFGLGPGIARSIPGAGGLIERFRAGLHEKYGKDHINLDMLIKLANGGTFDLGKIHIDTSEKKIKE